MCRDISDEWACLDVHCRVVLHKVTDRTQPAVQLTKDLHGTSTELCFKQITLLVY